MKKDMSAIINKKIEKTAARYGVTVGEYRQRRADGHCVRCGNDHPTTDTHPTCYSCRHKAKPEVYGYKPKDRMSMDVRAAKYGLTVEQYKECRAQKLCPNCYKQLPKSTKAVECKACANLWATNPYEASTALLLKIAFKQHARTGALQFLNEKEFNEVVKPVYVEGEVHDGKES